MATTPHGVHRQRSPRGPPLTVSVVTTLVGNAHLEERTAVAAETDTQDPRKVFVIHGRNDKARRGLFEFLRSIGLDPIEWSEATRLTRKGSPYIGQILDAAFGAAQAVVVLQTPDDVAYLHESLAAAGDPDCSPQMQPRPNVLFEAGLAMGRDEDRTVIVEMGQIRVFSDIHGRHVVRLDNSLKKRQELATRLETAGCAVRTSGSDWHEAGDLTPPAAPGEGLPLGRKLPSSRASGRPRLEARLIDNGRGKMDSVQVTNHGPGDVYELDLTGDKNARLVPSDDLPLHCLPEGKSIRVFSTRSMSLGSSGGSHFNVMITGKTADGTPIEQEEFVSGS
jgi:predicted nucleotide-binding protein